MAAPRRPALLRLYSLALWLLAPGIFLRLAWRGLRHPAYLRRWPQRLGYRLPAGRDVIWVHAVSVGEARASAPLVAGLLAHGPVLVTTMTPTGADQVRALFGPQVAHCYLPYDLPGAVGRFLDHFRPRLAVIMETELWPNLFAACRARGVPLAVANLRLSERSARGYRRWAALSRFLLRQPDRFAVQGEADADRLIALGAPAERVQVTGNVKFELKLPASQFEMAEARRREWGSDRPVWLAASTREGEETRLLEAWRALRARFPDLLWVVAPRHPERFGPAAVLLRRAGARVALLSKVRGRALAQDVEVLVADSMGELLTLYGAADVAFVGGSLVPTGGHNILEPCAVGTPVVFGPHMYNFAVAAELVCERGAGVQVKDPAGVAAALGRYLAEPGLRFEAGEAGRRLIAENQGAAARTLDLLQGLLRPAPAAPGRPVRRAPAGD